MRTFFLKTSTYTTRSREEETEQDEDQETKCRSDEKKEFFFREKRRNIFRTLSNSFLFSHHRSFDTQGPGGAGRAITVLLVHIGRVKTLGIRLLVQLGKGGEEGRRRRRRRSKFRKFQLSHVKKAVRGEELSRDEGRGGRRLFDLYRYGPGEEEVGEREGAIATSTVSSLLLFPSDHELLSLVVDVVLAHPSFHACST